MAGYQLVECPICGRMMRIPFGASHIGAVHFCAKCKHPYCGSPQERRAITAGKHKGGKPLADVWYDGRNAANAGADVNDNPYKHDPHKRAWVLGYIAGREDLTPDQK